MKIYLDNCAIQRPLDDKSNLRNRIESEAVMGLIELFEQKKIEIVNSDVLIYELNNTPDIERIYFGRKVLSLCTVTLKINNYVKEKALEFEKTGIKPIDALHLSLAVVNEIKYLCTCDDKFIRKAQSIKNINTKVILPTDLIKEVIK